MKEPLLKEHCDPKKYRKHTKFGEDGNYGDMIVPDDDLVAGDQS